MESINIDLVRVGRKRRELGEIDALADSIANIGLINPISVTEDLQLIAGLHRLEACKSLGWQTIPACIISLNELDSQLAEIDENLIRNEFTVLERSEQLKRRKDLYEAKFPQAKHGTIGNGRSRVADSATLSFAKDVAKKTQKSSRTISEDIQIAKKIPEEIRDQIRDTPLADKKTELLTLSQFDSETQKEVVEMIVANKVKTVEGGLTVIAQKDAPEGFKSGAEVAKEHQNSAGTKWRESLYKTLVNIQSINKQGGIKHLSEKWSVGLKRQYIDECRRYAEVLTAYATELEETL